jgi:site-specific DNA-methyltransferase (adenine-specific)
MYNILNVNFFDEVKNIEDESIDLILTDPPYGISHVDGFIKASDKTKAKTHSIMGDNPNDINWDIVLSEFYRILKPNKMCYIFGRTDMFMRIGKNIIDSDLKYCHDFIWRKGDMNYGNLGIMGNIHELCIGLSKENPEKSRPLIIDGVEKKRYKAEYNGKVSNKEYYGHPTQKPIGLLSYIILGRTDVGDIVFDPFAGAGSTNVACEINNRNSLSYELDTIFYDIANKRLNDEKHMSMCKKQVEGGLKYSDSGLLSFPKFE